MSHIDDLIAELCPEGIEWGSIGEVFAYEQPTKYLVQSTDYVESGIRVLTAGQTFVLGHTQESDGVYQASSESPVIIFDDFTTSFQWVDFPFKAKSSAMKMITPRSGDPSALRFLFHWMSANRFRPTDHARHWISVIAGQKIPKLAVPIQEEIVRTLDSFTELEAELEAELEVRTTQYEETRNRLLDFDGDLDAHPLAAMIRELSPGGVPRYALNKVADYSSKRVTASQLGPRNFVGVDNLLPAKKGRVDSSHVPTEGKVTAYVKDDVLLGNIRPYLRKIWLATDDGGCSGDVLAIQIRSDFREILDPRFLYFSLSSDRFFDFDMQHAKGAKMPRGNKAAILEYPVFLPPVAVQEEIVRVLDSFEALVSDISIGLPAEMAARRKQYEYYRDKLLSFKGLAA